jgi:hypothetical protein
MKKILAWIDHNLLTILSGLLIVAVPLYPKIPLADVLPGYIVRVRLDDILVGFSFICFIVQLLRKKAKLPPKILTGLVVGYLVIGLLSALTAIFILHTISSNPNQILKIGYHWARRVEYFSVLFVIYGGIRSKKDIKLFLSIAVLSLVGAVLYGFGQKYLYWPAFSTMNREFSKGMRLYLTPQSRVMSTFGGHYDYAAYLMMALGAVVPAMWIIKKRIWQIVLGVVAFGTYWSLLLTASRASWGGFVAGLTISAIILALSYGWKWSFKRYGYVMLVSLVMMFTIGDLSERFFQIIQSPATLHKIIYWIPEGQLYQDMARANDYVLKLQALKRQLTEPHSAPPKNSVSTDELAQVATPSDTPPQTSKSLPPDVTKAQDDIRTRAATESATATSSVATGGGYSANALKYGLSVAIRLDALWPRAIEGFMRDPLLGSGYSTLTKSTVDEFTQAESTDNDYLRMLGETGLLGTLSFLGILGYLAYIGYRHTGDKNDLVTRLVSFGIIGSIVGLLVNAATIDVFESSKVAYSLWILSAVAIWLIEYQDKKSHVEKV